MAFLRKLFLLLLLLSTFTAKTFADDQVAVSSELLNALNAFKEQTAAPAEQAQPFTVTAREGDGEAIFDFTLLDGAYIYKESFKASASEAVLGKLRIEGQSTAHQDLQGSHEVYFSSFTVRVPLISVQPPATLALIYQGCSSDGICYPPEEKMLSLTQSIASRDAATTASPTADQDYTPIEVSLEQNLNKSFILGLLLCLLLGMGLNLTPCVLPMLPIFSMMITGGSTNKKDGLTRSAAYALGLAVAYMLIGLVFSLIGARAQAFFQHPLTVGIIALILLLCAANAIGLIGGDLLSVLSAKLQSKLKLKESHSFKGAFALGLICALVATPCTSAPLAGAILFVTQEGDLLRGALSFFAIGLGMSIPLFVIAIFGRSLFMRAGKYSELIKKLIAIPLFLAAVYIARQLFGSLENLAISISIFISIAFAAFLISELLVKQEKAVLFTGIAAALLSSASYYKMNEGPHSAPEVFTTLTSISELETFKNQDRKLLIDFTADWCTNCQAMDEAIFRTDYAKKLCAGDYVCLRFDLTDMRAPHSLELVKAFGIIGVPHIEILNPDLSTRKKSIGFLEPDDFKAFVQD